MNEDLVCAFYQDLLESGKSKRTACELRKSLRRFFRFLDERGLEVQELRLAEAQAYLGWLKETGRIHGGEYAKGTLMNLHVAALDFYRFLKKRGVIATNPFSELKKIRVELKLPRNILKEKEMHRLLGALEHFEQGDLTEQQRKYKVHVVAELQYASGLRIHEVASLRVEDIDFERGTIEVPEAKGGKRHIAFLNEYARKVLYLYVHQIRPLLLHRWNRGELLFGVRTGRLMNLVNQELKRRTQALGLKPITSHGFRHALGAHLLRAGCDIRHIQDFLGHVSLQSTEVYTKVEKEDLRRVLDRYHPRQFPRSRP